MKAIVIDRYGGSDALRLAEQPEPKPGPGETFVRIRAAGVNPVDWKIRRGDLRMVLRVRLSLYPRRRRRRRGR